LRLALGIDNFRIKFAIKHIVTLLCLYQNLPSYIGDNGMRSIKVFLMGINLQFSMR
jgi:hypothetical protein